KIASRAIEQVDTHMPNLTDDDLDLDNLDVTGGEEDLEGEAVGRDDVEDAPIVRFVNKVLLDAIKNVAGIGHSFRDPILSRLVTLDCLRRTDCRWAFPRTRRDRTSEPRSHCSAGQGTRGSPSLKQTGGPLRGLTSHKALAEQRSREADAWASPTSNRASERGSNVQLRI